MTRMGKELTLVLVGSSILTAGYFLWPSEDLEKKNNEAVNQQVAGHQGHTHYAPTHFMFIHTGGWSRGPTTSQFAGAGGVNNVSKGGFGHFGRTATGVS